MMILNLVKALKKLFQMTPIDWLIWGLIILAAIIFVFLLIRRAGIDKVGDAHQPSNQEEAVGHPVGLESTQTVELNGQSSPPEVEAILIDNTGRPQPEPVIPRQPAVSRAVPAAEPAPDDLKRIRGVTPGAVSILSAAGIRTFRQLAEISPERLELILRRAGMRLPNTSTWTQQARLADAGDWEGLENFQKQAASRV
jgi:predicted flap endonuclease-1-like 5' DNA nuclease